MGCKTCYVSNNTPENSVVNNYEEKLSEKTSESVPRVYRYTQKRPK